MHQSPVRFGSITWICVHVRKVYVKRLADCVEITLQLMSHESLLFITKMRGRVQVMGLCVFVTVCFCTSYVCDGGHVAVSWALKDSTALHFRGGEGGQRVNSRFCPAATSVSQTESAVLFRLPPFSFNDSSHSFVLTSLLSLFPSHLCLQ